MGLKELFQLWTKGENARVIEQAEEESQMTPYERDLDREDFEGRKQDLSARNWTDGAAAEDTAADEFR